RAGAARGRQCERAGILPRVAAADRAAFGGRLEDLSAMARRSPARAVSFASFRRTGFRVLRQVPARRLGDAAALDADLRQLPWMGEATRQQALTKLHGVVNKIGYPEHPRDYSSIKITRDNFLGDVEGSFVFERKRTWPRSAGRWIAPNGR